MAKTTGSQAVLILPDGSEQPFPRRGLPSILEQKKLIRLAARIGAKAIVAEMMSIREECLAAESCRIIRPEILILTNVRLDHLELMGRTKQAIAACFAAAFPRNGTVILPAEELFPVFSERAAALDSKILSPRERPDLDVSRGDFEVNTRLAVEAARALGIEETVAIRGIAGARPDFGSLKILDIRREGRGPDILFVSAFAANDPESTTLALEKVFREPRLQGRKRIGLLNLRADRGDRTRQWAEALEAGEFYGLDVLALLGSPSRALALRLRRRGRWIGDRLLVLREKQPRKIFGELAALAGGPAVVVGLGNIGGAGAALVEASEHMESAHDL